MERQGGPNPFQEDLSKEGPVLFHACWQWVFVFFFKKWFKAPTIMLRGTQRFTVMGREWAAPFPKWAVSLAKKGRLSEGTCTSVCLAAILGPLVEVS